MFPGTLAGRSTLGTGTGRFDLVSGTLRVDSGRCSKLSVELSLGLSGKKMGLTSDFGGRCPGEDFVGG